MERGERSVPDWRDAQAYVPLLAADRAILAWEWLRRVPAYRDAAARAGAGGDPAGAARWGLHRFEDPHRTAPRARPLWTAQAFDAVLTGEVMPAAEPGAIDLTKLSRLATIAAAGDCARILLSDGLRLVRLDLTRCRALAGQARLRFSIAGPPDLAAALLALRRFDSLVRLGRFAQGLHRPWPRARRHLLVLRAADALAAGAGQREMAAALLDPAARCARWREERPDLRLQAQRLVRDARANLAGGYRRLLGGR